MLKHLLFFKNLQITKYSLTHTLIFQIQGYAHPDMPLLTGVIGSMRRIPDTPHIGLMLGSTSGIHGMSGGGIFDEIGALIGISVSAEWQSPSFNWSSTIHDIFANLKTGSFTGIVPASLIYNPTYNGTIGPLPQIDEATMTRLSAAPLPSTQIGLNETFISSPTNFGTAARFEMDHFTDAGNGNCESFSKRST